jgi:hypothetical protein
MTTKQINPETSRGIRKIERLIKSGKLKIVWHPPQQGESED